MVRKWRLYYTCNKLNSLLMRLAEINADKKLEKLNIKSDIFYIYSTVKLVLNYESKEIVRITMHLPVHQSDIK